MLTEQERFLLRTLTTPFNRSMSSNLDTENFIRLTKDYLLSTFAYFRLLEETDFKFPPKITKELKERYIINLKMNIRQKKETLSIINILNKKKVPVILLKGPLLGERIYPKEGMRGTSIDVDLLIRYPDIPLAERSLADIGYRISHCRYQWLERTMGQVNCLSLNQKMLIELHWSPFLKNEWGNIVPLAEYWSNGLNKEIDAVEVRFLSNELLFIYLCLVLCKETNRKSRIRYLLDLHFFLLRYKDNLDFAYLAGIISDYGLKPYISFCLDVLYEGFGLSYGIKEKLLGLIKVSALNKIIFKVIMDNKRKVTRKGSHILMQNITKLLLFSRGSFWLMVSNIYYTYKLSYLRFLEKRDLRPSFSVLVRHFFYDYVCKKA